MGRNARVVNRIWLIFFGLMADLELGTKAKGLGGFSKLFVETTSNTS